MCCGCNKLSTVTDLKRHKPPKTTDKLMPRKSVACLASKSDPEQTSITP